MESATFLAAYVQQLGQQQSLASNGIINFSGTTPDQLAACGETTKLIASELHKDADSLRAMQLQGELAKMVPVLANMDDTKAVLELQYGAVCSSIAAGSQDDSLLTEAKNILAKEAAADRLLFQGIPLMATTLLPSPDDAKNPAAHIIIARAQRNDLVAAIDKAFPGLADKPPADILRGSNGNYRIASAVVLRAFLLQRKCSDES
jgi:hypothetical protein